MPGFFLALVTTLLASMGGRDQLLVAQLGGKFGGSVPLLAAGWASAILTAFLAVFAGTLLVPLT